MLSPHFSRGPSAKNSFARPEFRSLRTETLATQASRTVFNPLSTKHHFEHYSTFLQCKVSSLTIFYFIFSLLENKLGVYIMRESQNAQSKRVGESFLLNFCSYSGVLTVL